MVLVAEPVSVAVKPAITPQAHPAIAQTGIVGVSFEVDEERFIMKPSSQHRCLKKPHYLGRMTHRQVLAFRMQPPRSRQRGSQ
jgi:hypothetical protein